MIMIDNLYVCYIEGFMLQRLHTYYVSYFISGYELKSIIHMLIWKNICHRISKSTCM